MTLVAAQHVWFWQTPSWNWSEFWAMLVLLAVSIVPVEVPRKRQDVVSTGPTQAPTRLAPTLFVLLNGRDGRWSTSKAAAVLWTYAVWFAFITILLHTNGKGLDTAVLKEQYLLLLGLPVGAAVIAKGITQTKVEAGKLPRKQLDGVEVNPLAGVGQLVANDSGQPDLLDFQYFGFNLLLLAYFFTQFLGHPELGLPVLPDTLVALSGVSATGYLGKKGLQQDTGPVITAIDPPEGTPGGPITISGSNLAATSQAEVTVQIGSESASVDKLSVGEQLVKIEATIPAGLAPGAASVRVINDRGMTSDPYPYTIKAA